MTAAKVSRTTSQSPSGLSSLSPIRKMSSTARAPRSRITRKDDPWKDDLAQANKAEAAAEEAFRMQRFDESEELEGRANERRWSARGNMLHAIHKKDKSESELQMVQALTHAAQPGEAFYPLNLKATLAILECIYNSGHPLTKKKYNTISERASEACSNLRDRGIGTEYVDTNMQAFLGVRKLADEKVGALEVAQQKEPPFPRYARIID